MAFHNSKKEQFCNEFSSFILVAYKFLCMVRQMSLKQGWNDISTKTLRDKVSLYYKVYSVQNLGRKAARVLEKIHLVVKDDSRYPSRSGIWIWSFASPPLTI